MFIITPKALEQLKQYLDTYFAEYIEHIKEFIASRIDLRLTDTLNILYEHHSEEFKVLLQENVRLREQLHEKTIDRATILAEKEMSCEGYSGTYLEAFTKAYNYLLFLDVLGKDQDHLPNNSSEN